MMSAKINKENHLIGLNVAMVMIFITEFSSDTVTIIKKILKKHSGDVPVYFDLTEVNGIMIKVGEEYYVDPNAFFLEEITNSGVCDIQIQNESVN